ncbi:MAG TPA: beta-mannosidase [Pseudonocardiaceae bacterium]|jgi:exo-1,4-beta-D-glucosaminidase|nr:beta-mannosidase [Pseudonocardiaceae bacterium]
MRRTVGAGLASGVALILLAAMNVSASGQTVSDTAADIRAAGAVAAGHTPKGLATLGSGGWKVLTSATATQGGAAISTPGFNTGKWLSVRPDDAGAPGTEVEALLQNNGCPNVFFADNMKTCFGQMTTVGAETIAQFKNPWWYRTDFTANLTAGQTANLIVNGVVGKADVWVDGRQIATNSTVTGAYTRFTFNVSSDLKAGTNSLAIEMFPNNPNTMLTVDDVDWNQIPPDNNTGIQFPVQLAVAGALSVGNSHIVQSNAANLSSSSLTVKTDVTNSSGIIQTGTVSATVTPPAGGGSPITVSRSVTVKANTTTTVGFTPSTNAALKIGNPKVWWPYQMGAQPLYGLVTSVTQNGTVANSTHETFGIRTVTSKLVGPSAEAPDGVRQYSVNGVPFVARGGGYAPDLFLHYSATDTARQIALLKNLGLNMIRLEGHFMPDDFYQQMDAAGMMIDAGTQCCDAWEPSSDTVSTTMLNLFSLSALTIGQNERDHPSVVTFSWSDSAPVPSEETAMLKSFAQADFDVPMVSSAEYNSSPMLGTSGEKEGPYDYVPPDYWYDTTHFDSTDDSRTNVGGSWGFDSEQSAGDTVPTLDSLNRFLSASDQSNLWQNPSAQQYHLNYENGHDGYEFGELFNFDTAMKARYGNWSSLAQYVEEAQVQDYENTRAQFEAFVDHANNATPSTGTLYWQVNKGWPSLLWNLYNTDSDQAGSFFGAKKADESLHVLYTQDGASSQPSRPGGTVTVDNLGGANAAGLTVESKVYDTAGKVTDDQTSGTLSLNGQQVRNSVLTPKVPAVTTPSTKASTYFVELLLRQNGTVVDRNVYWQSTQQDVVNWSQTQGNPQATMTQFADMTALRSLGTAKITAVAATTSKPGPNGADTASTVTITNTSSTPVVGFFLRSDIRRGNANGTEQSGDNEVTSGLWSDNDVTLWPGESQTLTVTYRAADLKGATPVIGISGFNVGKIDVAAPNTAVARGCERQAATAPGVLHIDAKE